MELWESFFSFLFIYFFLIFFSNPRSILQIYLESLIKYTHFISTFSFEVREKTLRNEKKFFMIEKLIIPDSGSRLYHFYFFCRLLLSSTIELRQKKAKRGVGGKRKIDLLRKFSFIDSNFYCQKRRLKKMFYCRPYSAINIVVS